MSSILMISIGAVLGAMCRWQLAVWLNPILSQFAFGTLAANWLGCLLIGIAMGFNLGESQRLLFISGFRQFYHLFQFLFRTNGKTISRKMGAVCDSAEFTFNRWAFAYFDRCNACKSRYKRSFC